MFGLKNEIVVDAIRPEWLRREIAEAVINGDSIKLQISHGSFDKEYYVKLVDGKLSLIGEYEEYG